MYKVYIIIYTIYMLILSFVGTPAALIEYLRFAEWAELDAIRKGAKVVKIFSDMSGYLAE